jgi:hypothetical protein
MSVKPSAQGSFAKTPFAHLLLYTQGKRLSGTLAVWPDTNDKKNKGQDRVLFQNGMVVAMRPVEEASSIYVGLLRLFRRSDAPYGFYEGHNLLGTGDGLIEERVDPYTLLARGLRDHVRDDVMEGVLSKISGKVVRLRSGVPTDRLELNLKETAFLDNLSARPATPEALIAGAELSSRDAKRLLYMLTLIRGIEATEGGPTFASIHPIDTAAIRRPAGSGEMRVIESAPPRQPLGASPFSSGRPAAAVAFNAPAPNVPAGLHRNDEQRWTELALIYERLDELNHFDLLKVKQETPVDAVTTAYYGLVKKFHPDRLPTALDPMIRCAQVVFERLTGRTRPSSTRSGAPST